MVRRFAVSLGLTAVLVVGCGGADTSNPPAFCSSYSTAFCNKAKACGAPGVTPSCSSDLQNVIDCPHFACADGRTFDSAAASQCIDAINGVSCTDAANGLGPDSAPAVCARVCK
jgi:hypothetical protein